MPNLTIRGALGGALLAALALWAVMEQGSPAAGETPPTKTSSPGNRPGVLVLKTGELVKGLLSQNAGGYVVEKETGNFLVPFDRIHVAAEDPHGAYEQLKARQPQPTPEAQVALARWCLSWKLYDEARQELREVLVANPEHKEARRTYAQLFALLNPKSPESAEAPHTPPHRNDGVDSPDVQSLAGLPPDLAKRFVIRVQPILVNRCGNASCHGPASERELKLWHVRQGRSADTAKNLDAVLRFVDRSAPENSPLLQWAEGHHGRNGRPIFPGSSGRQNLETLRGWINEVAKDGSSRQPSDPSKQSALGILVSQGSEELPDETLIQGRPQDPQAAPPLTPKEREALATEELLKAILNNERQDAFDPDEFNRKFGSPAPP